MRKYFSKFHQSSSKLETSTLNSSITQLLVREREMRVPKQIPFPKSAHGGREQGEEGPCRPVDSSPFDSSRSPPCYHILIWVGDLKTQ